MIDVFKNITNSVMVVDRNGSKFVFNPDDIEQLIEHSNEGIYFATTQPSGEDRRTTTLYTKDHMMVIDTSLENVVQQIQKQMLDKKVEKSLNE